MATGLAVRVPALGESFLGSHPFGSKTAKCVLAGGTDTSVGNVQSDTQETLSVFDIEASTGAPVWVKLIHANVPVAFTASVTMALGDSDNTAGFLSSTEISPTSTSRTSTLSATGVPQAYFAQGRVYTSTQPVNVVIGGADPATGILNLYLEYIVLDPFAA